MASTLASTSSSSAHTIAEIILFGGTMCGISLDGQRLFIWDVQAKELSTTIEFEEDFTATHVIHPSTYLNKVVVTSKEGGMRIINIQTRQIIHSFSSDTFLSSTSLTPSAITCVVQSPAIDVLALGFHDGRIVIFDIRSGETLLQFQMSSDSPSHLASITALSFRTDNEAQTLASADIYGNIALWDLDSGGSLLSVVRRAHERQIGGLQFFPGQPILISSGADNCIRECNPLLR
jgi:U3 small nucleolar RNA-associated protein 21